MSDAIKQVSNGVNKIMKLIFIISALLVIAAALSLSVYYEYANSPVSAGKKEIAFTVSRGQGVKEVAAALQAAGLVRSKEFFRFYVWWNGLDDKLQAGDYILSPGQSVRELARILLAGRAAEQKILIREGEDVAQIAANFEQVGLLNKKDFFKTVGEPLIDYRAKGGAGPLPFDFSAEFDFLKDKPKYYSLEGYLFPDTYLFSRQSTPELAVKKMLSNFDRKFSPELRREVSRQGRSVYNIVTMASILEKEVRRPEEMKIAAGIFWSRLKRGQALQSDATLSYVLGDTVAAHSQKDLKFDSPYNTYKYAGLPPTPIGNPGIEAIKAAIYPAKTDYNFFLTDKNGETYFAKTFEEHVRNKAKYLK